MILVWHEPYYEVALNLDLKIVMYELFGLTVTSKNEYYIPLSTRKNKQLLGQKKQLIKYNNEHHKIIISAYIKRT